mgnify:CR=1 FL=1
MIEIKTFAKPKKTGSSSGSSSSTKYISGVISEAEHAARADKAKRAEVADQANYAGTAASAQNAAYASEAGNLHEDAEILQQYLSLKDTVDPQVVNGMVIFAKGLIAKACADLAMGAKFGNNAMITELGDAVFNTIKSLDYDNAAEQGFSIEKEKNGKYHAFITNLTIWGKAIFHELEVRKLSYSGGNIYLSGAGSKLIKVVPVKQFILDGVKTWVETTEDDAECVGWKCYLLADNGTTATMNYWQEGDQVRCQTMGEIVAGGTYADASNKSYWRTIPDGGVSTQNEKIYGTKTETYLDEDGNEQTREVQVELYDGQAFAWIVIGKHSEGFDGYTEDGAPAETTGIPAEGDTIVLDGNRHRNEHGEYDKTDRQNVIVLETTGDYAPRIACFANITEYKHTFEKIVNGSKKEVSLSVFETSPKGGTKINSSRFEWISDDGSTINIINYRGDWVKDNAYHKNDQVNHNNAVWVCIANSGVDVTDEPSDGSKNWKKVLVGGKGEKGDKGEDGLSGNGIVPIYTRSEDTPTPPTSADKNNLDNGWSLTIPSVCDVENVSYGDSSWADYNDDSGCTWKKSPTTAASSTSSCLVTFTTTQANQVVKFVIKSFSEPRYDYVFLSEIDAGSVPSRPTSNGRSRAVSGNGVELSVTDIIATAGTHTVYVCYGKDASGDFHGDYGLFRIGSAAGIPLWQSNGKEVFTRGDDGATKSEIESWSEPFKVTGEDGTDGKDAVSYNVTLTRGSNGVTQGLYVGVTRYIGTACTTGTIIELGMSCKAYTDGTLAEGLTDRLQTTDNYIDFSAFPKAKSFTVELFDKNNNKVATGNYSAGDDAISILLEDAPLVFDTDDNGTVSSDVTKTAKVKVMKGNTNVTNDCTSESSRDDLSSNCGSSVKKDKDNECINVSIQGDWITKNDVIVDGVNQGQVSATSGYAVAQFVYAGVVYFAQVPFSVNVAKFTGAVAFDNKSYKIQFDELSKNAATKDELKNATSTFEQTAREISLSVSEKSIGRRNLLVDSAFLREDNNRVLSDGARIEMNSGYQGTNCINVIDKTKKGDLHYIGVYWDGSQGGRSIKIEKGKKYTLSCYYKTNRTVAHFYIEAIYTDKQENATRLGQVNYLSPNEFKVKKIGEWELFTTVIDTTDAESDYIAFNFWEACKVLAGTIRAWICRPMVEEGTEYNGWTLSEKDYDFIGANLIDNSRTFDLGGNIKVVKGTKKLVDDAYELSATLGDEYNTFFIVGNEAFELDTDYTLSFEVKGDAKYIGVYAYYKKTDTPWLYYKEQQDNPLYEKKGDGKTEAYVGLLEEKYLAKQHRVWVHFKFKKRLPEYIYFQFPKNAEQTDVTSWNVTITKPKIEVGAVVTEYTERKSDLVDKASLKAAGIEVTANKVKLYGNQIEVKPTKEGNAVYALFGDDGFINTNILNVQHVYAKNASGTVYGHFGYLGATGGTDSDGYQYPLWVGASTCGSAPFSVRSDGYIYATKGKIGPLNIDEKGLFYYPLDINAKLRKATDLRLGGLWVSENLNDCNSELMVGNRCWAFDPLNESKQLQFTSTTLFSYPVIRPSVMIAKRWPNLGNGDSRTDPASPALMVESEGVGITSNGLNYLGGIAMGCTRTSVITNDTLTAMNLNRISFVVMTNGSEYTFPMPKTPVIGQILIVVQGNAKINFDPQGKTIYCGGKIKTTSDKFYSSTVGQFNIFIYDGYYWQLQWINQKL